MLARHHLGQAERARKMAGLHSARCTMATIRFAIFALFKLNNLPIGQRLPDFASFAPVDRERISSEEAVLHNSF
jgi:hypothetical protein